MTSDFLMRYYAKIKQWSDIFKAPIVEKTNP